MVTQAQANKALAQIKKKYKGYWGDGLDAPKLVKNFQWTSTIAPYAIVWESGPYEWTQTACQFVEVENVFAEPYTQWALGLYEA